MTTEVLEKQFQVYVRPPSQDNATNKSYALNEDGSLTIEGIASTTSKDLQYDIVTSEAIESMKLQLSGGLNLHGDHYYGLFDGVIGAITEVLSSDEDSLHIKAVILPKYANDIKEMLSIGVKLGLSIGGSVTKYTPLEDGGWEINDIALREISLTAMPANWDTYGTITTSKGLVKSTCLTGACYTIMKNEVQKMTDIQKEDNNNSESLTKEDVIDLINETIGPLKEELVPEIVDIVSKEFDKKIDDAVASAVESALNNNEGKPSEEGEESKATTDDESNEDGEAKPAEDKEEDDEEKSVSSDEIKSLFQSEFKTIKSELKELIPEPVNVEETVNKAVSEEMDKLFKNLDGKREPSFKYNEEEATSPEEEVGTTKSEFTTREIAEQLVAKQNTEEFLKSLL